MADKSMEEDDYHVEAQEKGKRQEQIEKEKEDLLARMGSSDISTMRHRVAWVLNHFPSTRNSDIALQIKYWECFDSELYRGSPIEVDDLYRLTRLTFPPKTRPLAWKFTCVEMGPTGGAHDSKTAHGGTDHRSAQGCPNGHWGLRALPQARHLGCHLLYKWRTKYAGLEVSDVKKLRQLEDENRRLKQMVAEQALDIQALKAVTAKNW